MSALPVLSGRELVKVLVGLGYAVDRQRGSHIILRQQPGLKTVDIWIATPASPAGSQ